MKLFTVALALAVSVLDYVQAIPVSERFSALRRGSNTVSGFEDWDNTMKENVNAAKTLVSFAANRVDYQADGSEGKTMKCIQVEDLEKAVPGIKTSYMLTNPKFKDGSKKKGEGPGLAEIGHKCIACGLVNAIFFREFCMKLKKPASLMAGKKDGNGGHATTYYLDFLTMKNASPLHTHTEWETAWNMAAAQAQRQYFLVDDAFMKSPNCKKEVESWKAKTTKPQAIVFRGDTSKFFQTTDTTCSKDKLKELFGEEVTKFIQIQSSTYIPAKVQALMAQCPASATDYAPDLTH